MNREFVFALENAGWPVLLVDSSFHIARASATASRLFCLAADEDEPLLSALWSPQNPATADKFLDAWERAPAPSARLKFRTRGGETVAFTVSICAFFKEGGKYFVLQLLPDAPLAATEEKTTVGDATQAQKQKLECALQLARSVSLDFNNALTSILGHTSLVLGKMETDHPWRHSLLEVEKAAGWAAEIANDLGAFSRQEKETRTQAAGNLNAVLQRTADFFRQNPGASHADFQVLLERKLFTAKFDEAKMQQAFAKIVENAVQAIEGPGRITIQTRNVELAEKSQDRNVPLAPGAYVCTEIIDTGRGIAPEVLPRVFEPFFTTKGGAHRGLGLAWVYGVVTNHGGGVAVSSQPGSGTSVRVYLPAETRVVRDHVTELIDLRGSQTVLMVDDEDLLLTMGQTILSAYGYHVLTANSGQKALELLAREPKIDLVITDLVMPSMSGRELVERIRQEWPFLPILCTSGYGWQATSDEESAYLPKPFTSQELLLKVKDVLALQGG
ncbi:MAG TPA: ATP-binding protein [Verrucomicrobiae bacterium]